MQAALAPPADWRIRLDAADLVRRTGRVSAVRPDAILANGPLAAIGTLCAIDLAGSEPLLAEITAISEKGVTLAPFNARHSPVPGALVEALPTAQHVGVGSAYLGRVVNAMGQAVDDNGPIKPASLWPLQAGGASPLDKHTHDTQFVTGIRAIDAMLPLAHGQRIGIFAAAGVGKTSLLNQIARQSEADVVIACMIGERGREVQAFWDTHLTKDARGRTTLVAATSDESAAMRVRSCHYAIALASFWRAQGKHVLLLIDSITRLAMAYREIGLAAGEPPIMKGYTPLVFGKLPQIVEACGSLSGQGAITAIMSVLSEDDDNDDAVCELMKSLLDGHIILSRPLANKGHFPAIDLLQSISRQADYVASERQRAHMTKVRDWLGQLDAGRTLLESGLYRPGSNTSLDEALKVQARLDSFLKQDEKDKLPLDKTLTLLNDLAHG